MREILSGIQWGQVSCSLYLLPPSDLILFSGDSLGRRTPVAQLTAPSSPGLVEDQIALFNQFIPFMVENGWIFPPESQSPLRTKVLLKEPFLSWILKARREAIPEPRLSPFGGNSHE